MAILTAPVQINDARREDATQACGRTLSLRDE